MTANTLRYSGGTSTTAIGASNTITLNGLMNAGTAALTISGGPTTGGIIIGSTNELVITANAQATTISSAIKDGGAAGTLVYNGAGNTLTLSGTTSTYSGGTVINSGIVALTIPASGSLDGSIGTGPIIINNAGRLRLATSLGPVSLTLALTLNGGTFFFDGSGNNFTLAGSINLAANSTIETKDTNSGFPAISATMSGTGGFTKVGTGGLRLNGTSNNYDGPTVVGIGGLTVKSSLYGNNTSKWTPANITVAAGGTLMLNVAGAGEFSLSDAATMFGQLATNVNNNGLLAGSTIGVDTRNAANGTYTYSSVITDSTGPGGGSVNFKHTGTSTTILDLTGANTYSGTTIVDNGSVLRVSSFNSVFTNPELGTVHLASSSLGAPTTIANGTIHLGSASTPSNIGNSFQGGSLRYVGTGETTDRIISLNGGGNETYILDQSGTGQLKFLSSFIMGDNRATKTIALHGSTAGTGEIAGTIPNAGNGNNQLTKSGTGTWILSGTNLYSGTTIINTNGGRLQFAKQASLYNNTESSWTKANIIVNSGGTLGLNVGGTGEFTAGNVAMLLTNLSTSIGNNGLRAGSIVGFDTTNAAGGSLTLTYNIANSTGTGSGAIGVTKLGTNTLVLAGTSNYTGPTTISAGVLAVDGSLGNTTTVVKSGGTLKGSGSISGIVTIESGGSIAAGNSIGSLATGSLTLNAGSNFAYEIDNGALPASAGDLTAVTGNFNLTSTPVLSLTELGSGAWDPGDKLTLISYSGTWNGALFTMGSPLADDSAFTFSGMQWMFNYNDSAPGSNFSGELTGSSFVTMTAVPEPGAALLAGFACLVIFSRRRAI